MGQCYNSIIVDAPVNNVWSVLRNFHDMSWSKTIETVERVGDRGSTEIGARRLLTGVFDETLVELDNLARSLCYSIENGPPPLSGDAIRSYFGTVQVYPVTDTNKSFVLWTSEYETNDDESVHDFCDPLYQKLLKELAQYFA